MPENQVRCGYGGPWFLAMILDQAIKDGTMTSEEAVEFLRSIPQPPPPPEKDDA